MRKINIIYTGKIKAGEQYYNEIINEYIKRLKKDFKISNIEIKEEKIPENPNSSEIAGCLEREGERILEKISPGDFVVALCPEGTKLSSEKFAELLYSRGSVDFLIGSSHGLSDKVKKTANYRLSLSDMTFNHTLARVMLTEQIYRAYAIDTGKKYHK